MLCRFFRMYLNARNYKELQKTLVLFQGLVHLVCTIDTYSKHDVTWIKGKAPI